MFSIRLKQKNNMVHWTISNETDWQWNLPCEINVCQMSAQSKSIIVRSFRVSPLKRKHLNNAKTLVSDCIQTKKKALFASFVAAFFAFNHKTKAYKKLLDSHYSLSFNRSFFFSFASLKWIPSGSFSFLPFVHNVLLFLPATCITLYFVRFHFDSFFHLSSTSYNVLLFFFVLLSPLYRQTAVRFIYI